MARRKAKLVFERPIKPGVKEIKVRLDHRTIITVSSKKALEVWRTRYPKLEVIA